MRKLSVAATMLIALSFSTSAWAQCYTYTFGPSSYTTSNTSSTTMSCISDPAWNFGTGNGYAQVTFTLQPGDPIANPSNWQYGDWLDFHSPGAYGADNMEIGATVEHNYTLSYYNILYWNGGMGTISCAGPVVGNFTATTGDTITIYVRASNYNGTANINMSVPRIFNCP